MLETVVKAFSENLLAAMSNSHVVRVLHAVICFILQGTKFERF